MEKKKNPFLDNYKTYDDSQGYGTPKEWKKEFFKRMNPDEVFRILNEDDPYSILGINERSTKTEIKKAFYKMAMKWHPDKNPENKTEAEKMMKRINAVYSVIGF